MARTVNEGILEMLEAIYTELKSIKKQLKPKSEIKELKQRLDLLENKVSMLETWKTIDKPSINPYQPPIMFNNEADPSSPLFSQVMGKSNIKKENKND